jgi:hypothetical protein
MSVIRTCCNKELNPSCIYGCITRYCTNAEAVTYHPLDGSCSGYVNRNVYSALLREEVRRRDAEESSGTY